MFEIEWQNNKNQSLENKIDLRLQDFSPSFDKFMHLEWREHCLECAPPSCYKSCPHFLERGDKKCSNFAYGIVPLKEHNVSYGHAVRIKFRKWAKLEARASGLYYNAKSLDRRIKLNESIVRGINNLYATGFGQIETKRKLNGLYTFLKTKLFRNSNSKVFGLEKLVFSLTCYSRESYEYVMFLELPNYRNGFKIVPGINKFQIDIPAVNAKDLIRLYPENDLNVDIIIGHADIRISAKENTGINKSNQSKTKKVKCVIWDLDNTMWDGVLVEDGFDGIKPRGEIIESIKQLDSMGIVNSIASKNDHDNAWKALETLNISHLFVYPKINWLPKSQNIKEIQQAINISFDTIYFVDDSKFERDEVRRMIGKIRIADENEFPSLLEHESFKVFVTESSKIRRVSYQTEQKRQTEAQNYGSDYEEFLRSCNIELSVFATYDQKHIARAKELLLRTNQLNLSAKSYNDQQLDELFDNDAVYKHTFSVKDKYGDYGIVGFITLEEYNGTLIITNLVISCRVARKYIENALIEWLLSVYQTECQNKINAYYSESGRNTPILLSLQEMGFIKMDEEVLELERSQLRSVSNIISLKNNAEK